MSAMLKQNFKKFLKIKCTLMKTKLKQKEILYLLNTAWMYDLFNIYGTTDGVKHKIDSKWIKNKYSKYLK